MPSYIILGIDPGTTTAAAYLSYTEDVWDIEEGRGLSLRHIVRTSLEKGRVIALATDKAKPPAAVRRLRAWLGVPIITPRHDLTLEEKRRILPPTPKSLSQHAADALAAAVYAKRILTAHEESETRRYAHHGLTFTPQDFFKPPRQESSVSSSSRVSRKKPVSQMPPNQITSPPTHSPSWQEERHYLLQRIHMLTLQLREAEDRASYYQRLARRSILEEPKSSIHLDMSLLTRLDPIGIRLPNGRVLGRRGEPVILRDLGITLYLPREAPPHQWMRGPLKRQKTLKNTSSQKTHRRPVPSHTSPPSERTAQDAQPPNHTPSHQNAYALLERIITSYREERKKEKHSQVTKPKH